MKSRKLITTCEDLEKCRNCIERRQWKREQAGCVVSDRLLGLEANMMVIDDMKKINELKSDMDVEIRRLQHVICNKISNKKRKKIDRKQRTEFMKQRDNLRQSLRRCYLKILDLKSNKREKYILKRIRLSREYKEVS